MTDTGQARMSIGEVARLAGVTSRAIRHYHAVGVLPEPDRDSSGYRRYSRSDLLMLQRVVQFRAAAVPLDAIALLQDGGWGEEAMTDALATRAHLVHAEIERLLSLQGKIQELADHLPFPPPRLPTGYPLTLDLLAAARSSS